MSGTTAKKRIVALVLFGIAFGYLECAIVVYLREIYQPIRTALHPDMPADTLFPVITLEQLRAQGPQHVRLLTVELGRELSTLVMLAAVAAAATRNRREWFAAFALLFGVWDIFYYVFLKLLIGWPTSLLEMDVLFLLPPPFIWTGPVIAPMLVSVALIGGGAWGLWREDTPFPLRLPLWCWTAMITGGLIVIVSFCWDWRNVAAGNLPQPFRWDIFLIGLLGGAAAFLAGARRSSPGPARPD